MKLWVIVIAFELAALLGLNLAQLHTYVITEKKNAEVKFDYEFEYFIDRDANNYTIKYFIPENRRKSLKLVRWQEE